MMNANEKFKKALELQEQGISRTEIWKLLEYSCVDPLTKMFRKRGYRYDETIGKYLLNESDKSNTTIKTTTKSSRKVTQTELTKAAPLDTLLQENLLLLANQYQDIQDIIEWFKTKDNSSNTEVIQVVQGLHIDLPESENVMVSTRSNKAVWERFNKFCERHSQFKKGDLLAKALIDLIEAYDDK